MSAGFLPFFTSTDIALIFFGAFPGDTHGVEVSLVDWLGLSLLLAARPTGRPLPYRLALLAYFLATALSVTQARWTINAVGYLWKVGRMYLLFFSVWRAGCDDRRVPEALLRGMTLGIVYAAAVAVWQHYALGRVQATGSFAHQNTLGVLTNLIVMVSIARVLAGATPLLTRVAPLLAAVACLFTVSRGALLFLALGTALVFIGSAWRGLTPRKTRLALAGLALAAVIVPVGLGTIESSRSAGERAESMHAREDFEKAASTMLEEHPLGIGAGQYAIELLLGGYGERTGIWWGMRTGIVHNVYWLTAAEMGVMGVAALVLLFLCPLGTAWLHGLRRGRGAQGDVLLGLAAGLTTLYVHSFFEWIWRLTEVSYVFFMVAAVIPVLARQVRGEAAPRHRQHRLRSARVVAATPWPAAAPGPAPAGGP
jgi:O-antigen ligase